LRSLVLKAVTSHILVRAATYGLSPAELATLQAWRSELDEAPATAEEDTRGGAGESGVVLSPERYVPSEGLLLGERASSPDDDED
jgi:hypothetical protein